MFLLIIQVVLNLIYSFIASNTYNRLFKTTAIIIFPLLAIFLPILPLLIIVSSSSAPDASAFGYSNDLLFSWLMQIGMSLFIQILFNLFLTNKIQTFRVKAKGIN
ncbi:hypothetical protein [Xanthocytophaga agilis]|uniref:Uncharacterized protein n=1 Tax=Xanthocytophaga agilis TaxID=3048010 RepID=A0AAE3R965_9BACT|nr:hypothetical protein [Xanthocytophaga agilis]MDJ1505956.1 hypothetical protein [Xanthocytophaga agilis]